MLSASIQKLIPERIRRAREDKMAEVIQSSPAHRTVITNILSQAVTGEIVGMLNFASLAEVIDDVDEKLEAIEHSNCERNHAIGFRNIARKYGLEVNVNIEGRYWKGARDAFLKWCKQRNMTACIMIQEIMMESFAVALYTDAGKVLPGDLGQLFRDVAEEEKEHLEHSIGFLGSELKRNPEGFMTLAEQVHNDCMTVLGRFSAKECTYGHCGVCQETCIKDTIHLTDLDMVHLRGSSMSLYLQSLDKIGLPGDKTLEWTTNLPA